MSTTATQPAAASLGAVLEARELTRRFGEVTAVSDLSLAVQAGELYGLVGPDGAGKTTTIRLVTGLMKPDAGEASVLGEPAVRGGLAVREAIGYMPQQYSLYGDLSVDENLRFFGRLFGLPRREFQERRERLLHITRLTRFGDRRADALSGGMYKKLALACALLHRPRVLVLDEPTNGVDPVSRRELWELLYEFVAEGMAVLVATPYMDEAALCHRVGLIHQGVLLNEDSPETMTRRFPHLVYRVSSPRRAELEALIEARPEVLALTPHGASLRVVVRAGEEAGFTGALAEAGVANEVEPMRADFEDVFLGLIAARTGGQR